MFAFRGGDYLRTSASLRFQMLFDITAIDERTRVNRQGQPASDFTVSYHLMSFTSNCDVRLKVALSEGDLNIPSIVDLWPNANWYERECWDMFGICFTGHPNLSRILLPPTWVGHPLRKTIPRARPRWNPIPCLKSAKSPSKMRCASIQKNGE